MQPRLRVEAKAGNNGSIGRKSRDEATWPGAGEEEGVRIPYQPMNLDGSNQPISALKRKRVEEQAKFYPNG